MSNLFTIKESIQNIYNSTDDTDSEINITHNKFDIDTFYANDILSESYKKELDIFVEYMLSDNNLVHYYNHYDIGYIIRDAVIAKNITTLEGVINKTRMATDAILYYIIDNKMYDQLYKFLKLHFDIIRQLPCIISYRHINVILYFIRYNVGIQNLTSDKHFKNVAIFKDENIINNRSNKLKVDIINLLDDFTTYWSQQNNYKLICMI